MFVLYLFIILLIGFFIVPNYEGFGGGLVQLVAKGPQDMYLTSDADKYMNYYYPYYNEFIWNNGTRLLNSYYYPYYDYPLYPYIRYPTYLTYPTSLFRRLYY